MEELEFDYTNADSVKDYMAQYSDKQKAIESYALEYSGKDEGRKIRKLQIGDREDYRQGDKQVTAERLKIQYQKKIVNTAVSFLLGDAPSINANDSDNQDAIDILNVIKENRINSKLQDFAESVMSTTVGVFIFNKDKEDKIKTRFYDQHRGNYYPKYDVYGDLVAFFWEFELGQDKHIWIFTEDYIYKYINDAYSEELSESHDFGIIPVVFVEQDEPEWFEVKEMIDRLEMLISKLAGSNNYFAFPILKLKGGTEKDADGNDQQLIDISKDGKALLLGHAFREGNVIQSDADFLQRDTGVDSIKLEKELLQEFIHSISQTPDLSFNNVKGIGAISGRAMVLMLQDAINKAKRKTGVYKTAIERIISVIKHGLNITNEELTFDIEFNYSIPEDIKEQIEMLYSATGGKATMSQETAIGHNPMVKNPSEEADKIKEEQSQNMGETFNV